MEQAETLQGNILIAKFNFNSNMVRLKGSYSDMEWRTVKGNIFENPELIK